MKRFKIILLTIVFNVVVLTSCNAGNDYVSNSFDVDEDGNYLGFEKLPTEYRVEDAKKDGHYVRIGVENDENREVWEDFIYTSGKGKSIGIRIVSYFEDLNSPYFQDLFFEDGLYYLFDSSSDEQDTRGYSYLLTLEGKFGNPLRDSSVVVLTDDNTLTFDEVMKSLYSSNMEYMKSISPYKLVMFE